MLTTEKIWHEFSAKLLGFIRRRVSNQADAEDILHEVFIKIHRKIETLDDSKKINGWLFTLTRNTIIDYYRVRKTELSLSRETVGKMISEEMEPNTDARREINDCLMRLIDELPTKYNRALEGADIQEQTMKEMARREGLSLSGIKSRIHRGRTMLKQTLMDCCTLEMDGRRRPISMSGGEGCACGDC